MDVRQAALFYVTRLGFEPLFADSEERPTYAGVRRGQVEIHLQWHDPEQWERVERPSLRFRIDGVDALFEEYRAKDVFHASTQLRNRPWGTREFAFFDPDMNGLAFFSPNNS